MSNYRFRDIWWIVLFSCSANSGSWSRVCVLECWDFLLVCYFMAMQQELLDFEFKRGHMNSAWQSLNPSKTSVVLICRVWLRTTAYHSSSSHFSRWCWCLPLAHTFPDKFLYSSYTPVLICRQISEYMFVHAFQRQREREETAKTTLQILMCNTSGVQMVTFIQVSTLDTQTSCIFVRLWAALAVILLARNPAKKKKWSHFGRHHIKKRGSQRSGPFYLHPKQLLRFFLYPLPS